jgi:hypothetical protein
MDELENQVLQMLLLGEEPVLELLRQQAEMGKVSSREMTGVGFFSNYEIPPEAPRIPGLPNLELGDVFGSAENVAHGFGFILFVRNGTLSWLEGFTYDEPWPDELRGTVLRYSTGENRDLLGLRKELEPRNQENGGKN